MHEYNKWRAKGYFLTTVAARKNFTAMLSNHSYFHKKTTYLRVFVSAVFSWNTNR
jgi:hypothetical protein